mgnify:CR=1 FL=1
MAIKMTVRQKGIGEAIAVGSILLIGLCFRFWGLGWVRHDYDNAYPIYLAVSILSGNLLLTGQPSSVFLDNPPLMSYLMTIPLLFWRSPWAVYIFVAGLNTVGIWFVYQLAKRSLGTTEGLLSAFLFAISPWIVRFSRMTWLPALEPVLIPLIAWLFWPILVEERLPPRRTVATFIAITILTQTYIQSWLLLFPVGLLMALFWQRISRQALKVGILVFIIFSLIYGIGIIQKWEANRTKLENFLSKDKLHWTSEGVDHAVRLVSGWDFDYVHTRCSDDYPIRHRLSLIAHRLLALALVAGMLRAIIRLLWRDGKERRLATVLLVWFVLPILLMSISAHPVHPYYLLITCPAGHILAAWGGSLAFLNRRIRWLALSMLFFIGALFGLNLYRSGEEVARHPTTGPDFWGWSLEGGARVGKEVRDLCEEVKNGPCRISAKGHEALLTSLSIVSITIVPDLDFPNYIVLPGKEPLLYVLVNTPPVTSTLGPLYEVFPDRELIFADGTHVSFLRILPYTKEMALELPDTIVDWPSETGLSLLGYSVDPLAQPGHPLHLVTYWRVEALYPERVERYVGAFYHFIDQNENMLVNISGHGQWGYRWEIGDIYIEQVQIPIPDNLAAGTYQIRLGPFDFVHVRNYNLYSSDGPTQAIYIPVLINGTDTSVSKP